MKLKSIKALLSLAVAMILFTGCSSDDEPSASIDINLMESLTRGTASITYSLESWEMYDKKDLPDASWEKIDLSDYVGISCPAPSRIIVHDGKTWSPLELFDLSRGWHPLYFPWLAYQVHKGANITPYVTRPFFFDANEGKLTLNGKTYEVKSANDNSLVLIHYSEYYSNVDGTFKSVVTFKKTKTETAALSDNPFFASEKEAKLGIIEIIRNELGNLFDINQYLEPNISFPNPIVNLDRIEEFINEDKDWDILEQDIFLPKEQQ